MDSENPKEDMLRKKAEEILQKQLNSINMSQEEEYELRIHQIELEIQMKNSVQNFKNIEKALKTSENYREIFFNDHTVMMLIDPITGDIIDANIAASNFYGYKRDKLIKMNIADINVSDADSVIKEMQKAISNKKTILYLNINYLMEKFVM